MQDQPENARSTVRPPISRQLQCISIPNLPPFCTFVNPPTLIVTKIVQGGDLGVADFPLFIDGNPTTSGTPVLVSPGRHVVTEQTAPGYQASFSGRCDANGNIFMPTFGTVTCVITNAFPQPAGPDVVPTLDLDVEFETNGMDADSTNAAVTVEVGDILNWTYTVTNTGDVNLTGVTVTDDNGTPDDPSDDIAVASGISLSAGGSSNGDGGTEEETEDGDIELRASQAGLGETQSFTAIGIAEEGHFLKTATATSEQGASDSDASHYTGILVPIIPLPTALPDGGSGGLAVDVPDPGDGDYSWTLFTATGVAAVFLFIVLIRRWYVVTLQRRVISAAATSTSTSTSTAEQVVPSVNLSSQAGASAPTDTFPPALPDADDGGHAYAAPAGRRVDYRWALVAASGVAAALLGIAFAHHWYGSRR